MTTITINGAMTLGELLAFYRKRANIEQIEIASYFGVNRATISGWENGRTEPKFSQVVTWARLTGQPIEALIEAVNAETAPAEAGAVSDMRAPRDSNPQPSDLELAEIEAVTEWLGAGFDAEYQALLSVEAVEL